MQRFGEKLRILRTGRGLTIRELAYALGYTTHSYLGEVEAGRKIPKIEFILKVADFFQVSVDQLVRDERELDTPA